MNVIKLNGHLKDTVVFVARGVDTEKACIYVFYIDGVGAYVGKTINPKRRLREYPNNVRKYLAGEPYRKDKPEKFRKIHTALAKAVQDKRKISVMLIENWADKNIPKKREKELAEAIGTLND